MKIINRGHVQVLKLARKMLQEYPGSHIYKIKTDSVALYLDKDFDDSEYDCYHSDDDYDDDIYDDFDMGGDDDYDDEQNELDFEYHEEKVKHVECYTYGANKKDKTYEHFKPIRRELLNTEYINAQMRISTPEPTCAIKKVFPLSLRDDKEWLAILAPARLGKTYFINNLGLDEKSTLYSTSTNVSLKLITHSNKRTIQSICYMNINIASEIDTLIIDEISMVGYRRFLRIIEYCKKNNIRLIVSGDYHQLDSIDNSLRVDNSSLFISLFKFIRVEWSPHAAITKEKYDIIESINDNDDFKYSESGISEKFLGDTNGPSDDEEVILLAYHNVTVDKYNKSIKESDRKFYITTNYFRNKPKEDKRDIVNGQKLIKIKNIYYDWSDGSVVDIKKDSEVKLLHASTVHSFQGSDIVNHFGIKIFLMIDCTDFSREMLYTAITRTAGFRYKLINFIPGGLYKTVYKTLVYYPRYCLYAWYNNKKQMMKNIKPIYIGITNCYRKRCKQHLEHSKWCKDSMVSKILFRFYNAEDAHVIEERYIKEYKPIHNKQHNTKSNTKPPMKVVPIKNKPLKRDTLDKNTIKKLSDADIIKKYIKTNDKFVQTTRSCPKRIVLRWKKKGLEATIKIMIERIRALI